MADSASTYPVSSNEPEKSEIVVINLDYDGCLSLLAQITADLLYHISEFKKSKNPDQGSEEQSETKAHGIEEFFPQLSKKFTENLSSNLEKIYTETHTLRTKKEKAKKRIEMILELVLKNTYLGQAILESLN